jgi:NAD(P)-dependent dehydrogenase (short-subunit alcohol dehydrogenase family)
VCDGRQAAAEEHHGAVDAVICCAGVAHPGTFEDTPAEQFERLMRINFMGTVRKQSSSLPTGACVSDTRVVLSPACCQRIH